MITMDRFTIFICLFLFSCFSFAQTQTKESKELYAQAVELYKQGKYSECIPLFLKVDSLEYIGQQKTSNDNHWVASAYYKLGDEKKAVAYSSNFTYQLPVEDRRQSVKSDSLTSIAEKALTEGDFTKCEEYLLLSKETLLLELNKEPGSLLILEGNLASIYYLNGKKQKAIDAIDNLIKKCSSTYGVECLCQYYQLSSFSTIVGNMGDIGLMEQLSQKMFDLMQRNHVNSYLFLCEHYRMSALVYLQSNQIPKTKEYVDLQFQSIIAAYGNESIEYINQLIGWSSVFNDIKDSGYALDLVNKAEELVLNTFGKRSSWYGNVALTKANILQSCGQHKEAGKYLQFAKRGSADEIEQQYIQLFTKIRNISTKQQNKQKIKEKDVKDILTLYNILLEEVGKSDATFSEIAMSVAVIALCQDPHTAAQIADRHLNTVLNQSSYNPLFLASLVYLNNDMYVKARQANSAATQKLHYSMESSNNYSTAIQSEYIIDSCLGLLDGYKNKGVASDTTGYSVAMMRQDLLYSKLLIMEQKDSIATPTFMENLKKLLKTSYHDTEDIVMGDSIYSRYQRKFINLYGENSEQYAQLIELKSYVNFEIENHGIAYSLELASNDLSFPWSKKWYEEKLAEYNAAYKEWKENRGTGPYSVDETKDPKEPSITDVRKNGNYRDAMEKLEEVIDFRIKNDHYDLLHPMALWRECADSLGMEEQILPMLRKWVQTEGLNKDQHLSSFLTIAYLYKDLSPKSYKEFVDTLLAGNYTTEKRLEYLVASQIDLLDYVSYSNPLEGCVPDSIVLDNIGEIIQDMRKCKGMDMEVIALDFLVSGYTWRYNWRLGVRDRQELLPHYIELYELIKSNEELQHYSESYDILNNLCYLITDYSHSDKELTVKADRLRRQVRRNCEEDRASGESTGMWRRFLCYTHVYVFITLYESEQKEMETRIGWAYPSGDHVAHYEKILAAPPIAVSAASPLPWVRPRVLPVSTVRSHASTRQVARPTIPTTRRLAVRLTPTPATWPR